MTLPMLMAAHSCDFQLSMTVKSKTEAEVIGLLLFSQGINIEFICFQDYAKKGVSGYLKMIADIRKIKPTHIVPTYSSNALRYNLLAWASGAKNKIGLNGPLGHLFKHKIERECIGHKVNKNIDFLEQAMNFWISPVDVSLSSRLPMFKADVQKQKLLLSGLGIVNGPLVCLAPGSGAIESHKRWPIENYAQLALALLGSGSQVAIVGGPGEEGLGLEISKVVGSMDGFFDVTGRFSIFDALLFLNSADCVVANCNGISHLASAVQTPVVGLYGPTDPKLTGPYSEDLIAMRAGLECSPCYSRQNIVGCGNPVCMKQIGVSDVYSAVVEILRKGAQCEKNN